MTTRDRIAAAMCFALATVPGVARADRRYYGHTYNATTAEPGGLDVELWTTWTKPPPGEASSWVHQLELETGITDRWDLALYNIVLHQAGRTRYQALKLETRYRLSQPGEWFVDPVLYLEVKKEFIEDAPWALEGKAILAKDVGPLNFSVNLSAEQEWIPAGGSETEWGYYAGVSYELHPVIRLGAETFGLWRRAGGMPYAYTGYAGPALSLAAWRGWLVLSTVWGLGDQSDRLLARAILALQF
jgi:hypothetical protein